jgi:hypothetical protein
MSNLKETAPQELVTSIILYENGEFQEVDDVLTLFSALIKTGLAWRLQGHYGRTARHLIDIKAIAEDGTIIYDELPF